MSRVPGQLATRLVGALALLCAVDARAAEDLLVEVHFKPVPGAQIAIWLEDDAGKWVQDILVTQAVGKLGIGNRPGLWNFLSSWRAPYGPRPSVLPIWAHRRGKTYPKLVFYDNNPADKESLGYHESTSSAETYYCRPLTAAEHDVIAVDTMTCPSPAVFQTDKGVFDPVATSVYPPRNDLLTFEDKQDSPDAMKLAALNDLDAVTAATPPGDAPEHATAMIPGAKAQGPLTAWIEISLEHDENPSHDYDRADDHYIDPRLGAYGVEYLGQPSVVYKLPFDPRIEGFRGTSTWAGYGDWNGATGTIHPPDATISTTKGSGADRLQQYTLNNETFRFGVYSYGSGVVPPDPDTGDTLDADTTTDPDTGDTGDTGGWGHCQPRPLPPVTGLMLEGLSFDRVRVTYTLPPQTDPDFMLSRMRVHLLNGETPLTQDRLPSAQLPAFQVIEAATPGASGVLEVDQLWGNFTYQVGVTYQDKCGNTSALSSAEITTEAQKFQQVEGFCFLATAAYGGAWVSQVQALRWFRDAYLKTSPIGRDLVRFYYTYSPPLARIVAHQPVLRGTVRVVLQPIADLARLGARG
ncbi:MAG TPA: CFI-box-CTERM domain-containing protein [Nannocystis sp.]